MQSAVRIERVASTPIAVVRRRAPAGQLKSVVPEACGIVWGAIKSQGVEGAGRHVAVYRKGADGMLELEIGVELKRPFGGHGEVVDSLTPAGEAATVAHLGPYGTLGEAHGAIREWCAANGRVAGGANWEVYGHWLAAWDKDPSQIRTDVFQLLQTP